MSITSVITQEMRDAIGIESAPVTYEIEKSTIIKFAQAIEDSNPLFNDDEEARKTRYGGIIAPPTFSRSLLPGPLPVKITGPYTELLDGGSTWEYFEVIRPGDKITVSTRILKMFERDGRLGHVLFTETATTYTNQFNKLVATQKNTTIGYDPKI